MMTTACGGLRSSSEEDEKDWWGMGAQRNAMGVSSSGSQLDALEAGLYGNMFGRLSMVLRMLMGEEAFVTRWR